MLSCWLTNSLRTIYNYNVGYNICSDIFMQTRNYAARKGTRERKRLKLQKRKVKAVVEKVGFQPVRKIDKSKLKTEVDPRKLIDDSWKSKTIDNVWIAKYHQKPVYSLKEAIQFHRETHHPTMCNKPDAAVIAFIDLNMQRQGKKKYIEKFTKLVKTPYIFRNNDTERKILAFCKNGKGQEDARNAGATEVGGIDLIKRIQNGTLNAKDYNYIVAHSDILTDLLLIRGILKRRFPNLAYGSLSNNMTTVVKRFKYGIMYTILPHSTFKEYGSINVTFGLLDMKMEELEENFSVLIKDIESVKPKSDGSFIERVEIRSELTRESFKIDCQNYLSKTVEEETEEQEQEKDETSVIEMH
ncbi:39S ribosomal protein L1, mitochondrial [Eufriesea mexicana]|uniref:39S ribosomal protein L1, mitochondrial n=1 Tax=Eufriesea mexicana TaxID=516756 RepID=A0A310SKS1_9HYME|nr:PREDICTED: 50S ribosomal protein L1 [Eufriesea mexicana]OAD56784.1 39S ribosomal protein L1, mitochondrial [Eufriesea mexicana]